MTGQLVHLCQHCKLFIYCLTDFYSLLRGFFKHKLNVVLCVVRLIKVIGCKLIRVRVITFVRRYESAGEKNYKSELKRIFVYSSIALHIYFLNYIESDNYMINLSLANRQGVCVVL